MEQHLKVMFFGNFLHKIHQQRIVVHGEICFLKNGGELKLVRSNLIMAGLYRNSKQHTFLFQMSHKIKYSTRNRAKIMIVQLLPFGGRMAKKRSSRQGYVGS